MAFDVSRYLSRFIEEARAQIERLGAGIERLDAGVAEAEVVNELFRAAHTVKGSSRMMKLFPITELAHGLEEVLSSLRERRIQFDSALGRLLYRGVDALAVAIDCLEEAKDPAALPAADGELCAEFARAALSEAKASADASSETLAPTLPRATDEQPLISPSPSSAAISESVAGPVTTAEHPEDSAGRSELAGSAKPKASETVRVRVDKLNELIQLMGEFESSQARARHWVGDLQAIARDFEQLFAAEPSLRGLQERMRGLGNAIRDDSLAREVMMAELHERTLVMRMLPLAVIFDSLGRAMRELGRSVQKDVNLVVRGNEIELDRQVIDRLSDPLLHLLRNALDHGLESTEQRLTSGKPECGQIEVQARQEGRHVIISVSDDGRGIDLDAVRSKAVGRNLLSAQAAAGLSEKEVIELLFRPGFSTAPLITDLSGRGVGLDVVRRTLTDDLSGEIEVFSRLGQGTRFELRVPTTLSRLRVLLVKMVGRVFGLLADSVCETVQVEASSVTRMAGRRAIIVRSEFVPIVDVASLLGVAAPERPSVFEGSLLLVVVKNRHDKMAMLIDELVDERDTVIKPLPGLLSEHQLCFGVVELGDGGLASMLHVPTLHGLARQRRHEAVEAARSGSGAVEARLRVLVVDDSLNTRELEREVLEAHGYDVTLAEDGQDGLDKALAGDFAAVLTDVEMPRMDGFTLAQKLREDSRYRHRPIVMITSREREEDRRRGMQVGADAYIVKGDFEQKVLIDTLKILLG